MEGKLQQIMRVIRFFRARPGASINLLRKVKDHDPEAAEVLPLVDCKSARRIFGGAEEYIAAVGLVPDFARLQGIRSGLEEEIRLAREVLSPADWQKKQLLLKEAEAQFAAEDYPAAAQSFHALSVLDPRDLGVLCSCYASKMRAVLGPPQLKGRRGDYLKAEYAARKLEHTSEAIAYLRVHRHQNVEDIRRQNLRIFDYLVGGQKYGMFNKFSEAQVGAGLRRFTHIFTYLKARIEKESNGILEELLQVQRETIRQQAERVELESQQRAWAIGRQVAQERKTPLFLRAEDTFQSGDYAASADLFHQLLREIDPDDIQARCFYYLNLMHLQYDFLAQCTSGYTKFGKGKTITGKGPIIRAARRFWQRIILMRFFIDHKDDQPALTSIPKVRMVAPYMSSLIGGGPEFRVFSGAGEARVAAGLEYDPELLESKIKPEIDREAARFEIKPLIFLLSHLKR